MPPMRQDTIRQLADHQKKFNPIPEELDDLGKLIVDAAYTVHKNLGSGLLERVYEICFCHELTKRGLSFQRQIDIPVVYDGLVFDEGLRLDVLVENEIICELKAIEIINPVWEAQVLSHMKLTNKRLGYLINFNVVNIGKGIRRFVN
jgi:GxxExxY protein